MSKNFIQQYQEMLPDHVPNLWNRIEAGISVASQEYDKVDQGKAFRGKVTYQRALSYAATAAAVLCVIVMLPVLLSTLHKESTASDAMVEPSMEVGGSALVKNSLVEETVDYGAEDAGIQKVVPEIGLMESLTVMDTEESLEEATQELTEYPAQDEMAITDLDENASWTVTIDTSMIDNDRQMCNATLEVGGVLRSVVLSSGLTSQYLLKEGETYLVYLRFIRIEDEIYYYEFLGLAQ